jgi:hypothetical protein
MRAQAFRQAWSGSALGSIDMGRLAQMVSPEVVANAQKDPDFFKVRCGLQPQTCRWRELVGCR